VLRGWHAAFEPDVPSNNLIVPRSPGCEYRADEIGETTRQPNHTGPKALGVGPLTPSVPSSLQVDEYVALGYRGLIQGSLLSVSH
jgi:hypothetical protein